jgi:phosphohistidine phosphatase SixA
LTQFVSPDDEHDVMETCKELKINTEKRNVLHVGHLPRILKEEITLDTKA